MATAAQVLARLDEPMSLGYSAAGVVLECGRGVSEFKPGDRVAVAAPHAGVVAVPRNLCARIPPGVTFEQAAYTALGAVALEGVRLARASLGDRVLVIGMGLIGQLALCLLKAQGAVVFASDIDPGKVARARALGADAAATGAPLDEVMAFSDARGVDAVLITASTASNEPIEFAADVCRVRGRIVLVGVAGLTLPRPPFFKKELEFTVSSSLGPGRGDVGYEERGIDYPYGYVRWTAQRNMEAVLQTMAAGRLPAEKLTTHRLPIDRAPEAYELLVNRGDPVIGIVLEYPSAPAPPLRRVELHSTRAGSDTLGVSVIGAGNFARLVMLPTLSRMPGLAWRGLCSARGVNAEHNARKMQFAYAASDVAEVWNDPQTTAVFIATRHDLHAELVMAGLRAGKHIFVEKPLCIRPGELTGIADCIRELGPSCPVLMVGFNRRFAPATRWVREFFQGVQPLSINYRFAPGLVLEDSWTLDEDVGGGRIVGEACHAVDLCVALAGGLPSKVWAESVGRAGGLRVTDDRVVITMRHENGSLSNISYQAGGDRAAPAERIEIYGGNRTGVVDNWEAVSLWGGGRLTRRRAGRDKGHASGFAAFIQAVRKGGAWPIPWEELYGVAWASLMAVQSLRDGLPVASDESEGN